MAEDNIVCTRCGGTEFRSDDANLYGVCVRCGLESQETMNTQFDDWAEEAQGYQAAGARLLRRRERRERIRKEKLDVDVEFPTYEEAVKALGSVFQAHVDALKTNCDVDVSAMAQDLWNRFETACGRVEKKVAPSPPEKERRRRSGKRRKIDPWRFDGRCAADLRHEVVAMESILPLVYLSCRAAGAPVSAFDVERWANDGALPYFAALSTLSIEDREVFQKVSSFFRPVRVPTATTIAVAAEARFSTFLAVPFKPIDLPGLACRFATDFVPAVTSLQVHRLARLAVVASEFLDENCSETTAAAVVCLACLRYHDVETWVFRERSEPSFAGFPKTTAETISLPRSAETIAFFDLVRTVDADYNAPFVLAKDDAFTLADHLLRDVGPSTPISSGPLVQVVPRSLGTTMLNDVVPVQSPAAIVEFLAHDLLARCPPPILQAEVDRLSLALDRLVRDHDDRDIHSLLEEEFSDFLSIVAPDDSS